MFIRMHVNTLLDGDADSRNQSKEVELNFVNRERFFSQKMLKYCYSKTS